MNRFKIQFFGFFIIASFLFYHLGLAQVGASPETAEPNAVPNPSASNLEAPPPAKAEPSENSKDAGNQVFETNTDYKYDPVGKRDPFRPYRDAKVGIGQIRSSNRTPEPLERFDVKTLEVVAIVWDISKPKALIQDPEKGIHSVVKGQRIGKNEGYIAEIREGEVVVVELFDLNGKIVKEPYVMCIDKTKGCGS